MISAALLSRPNRRALFRYTAGDSLTALGATATRATTATYVDSNGVVQTAAINTARDSHYISGVRSLLLEGQRTNVPLWDRDLTNAAWVKTTMTVVKDQTGADGVANSASSLTATGANATVLQSITLASSARFQSAWVKRITGSGTIQMTTDNGATWTTIVVTASYTPLTIPTQTLANPVVGFRIVTSGDAIAVDYEQNEDGAFRSSPIPTTTVAVTRSADNLFVPWLSPPSASTFYIKMVDLGTKQTANSRVMQIGSSADANARLVLYSDGTNYRILHQTAGGSASPSGAAVTVAVGDVVELLAVLNADGSTKLSVSVNGAAQVDSATSSTLAFAAAWSDTKLWLGNLNGGQNGFAAYQSVKAARGVQSLATMRGL